METNKLVVKEKNYDAIIANLSQEQKQEYLVKANSINTNDINSIREYGSDISRTISTNGDMLLSSIKSSNSVEIVGYVNDLLSELGDFDEEMNIFNGQESNIFKRFFYKLPIIKKLKKTVDSICMQYSSVNENVTKIANKIETSKIIALKDNTTLQQIFEKNELYLDDLKTLIIGAKLKLKEVENEIDKLRVSDAESYEIQSLENFKNQLSKKIDDMQVTGYVFHQNLFQILAMQNNNTEIANKTDEIINHVIPIWKNQLPLAIMMKNQKESIKSQKLIAETTNKMLEKTADDLKLNSIEVAKASEESIINISTLEKTTHSLIEAMQTVKQIHKDAENNRGNVEASLKRYADEINNALKEN